ncbi:MAG: aldo/keto reductase [Rikenellaceae bacterium]
MSENIKNINRRDFFKYLGGATLVTAAATACKGGGSDASIDQEVPKGKMEYRTSKTKGDKISLLGYGGMRWPELKQMKEDGSNLDKETIFEMIDYALEHGVNYFDTSPNYLRGFSEKYLGEALSRHPRDKYFVATKLSNFNKTLWSPKKSKEMYYNSFKTLRVDYIDYMLMHSVGNGGWKTFKSRYLDNGMLDFLVEERKAGRIRNLGFSFHGDIKVYDYLLSRHDEIQWDFVQIQVNYIDWLHPTRKNVRTTDVGKYLYGELEKRDIDVIIMEPNLGGRLGQLPEYLSSMLKEERPNSSIASWAFRYAGTFPKVLTVLSGMTYMEHLQENITTYSPLEKISEKEDALLMEIAEMMMDYPIIPCTTCQYCMPCPYGIDIPSIFSHFNTCVCESNYPEDMQDENYVKARRAFLVGYDRSVPKLRQANHCIGCNECVVHCPQKIKIPVQMKKIARYVESLKQNTLKLEK